MAGFIFTARNFTRKFMHSLTINDETFLRLHECIGKLYV